MSSVDVATIASNGLQIPSRSGVSDLYLEFINQHWQTPGRGETLGVILRERSSAQWVTVGNKLLNSLLSLGDYSGLSMDGFVPQGLVARWLEGVSASGKKSRASLQLISDRVAMKPELVSINLTWNSLQSSVDSTWLHSFWSTIDSNWFNQGCDLIVSVYSTDLMSTTQWNQPLTIEAMGRTLGEAVGWMVPLDDNIGFTVGLPCYSDLYKRLMSGDFPADP